jgi:hypothetical protein
MTVMKGIGSFQSVCTIYTKTHTWPKKQTQRLAQASIALKQRLVDLEYIQRRKQVG